METSAACLPEELASATQTPPESLRPPPERDTPPPAHRDLPLLPQIVGELLQLFKRHPLVLQERGGAVIKELCIVLHADTVYLELAKAIHALDETERMMAHTLVDKLSMVLLTVPELKQVLYSRMLTCAHVCSRMLTRADVC